METQKKELTKKEIIEIQDLNFFLEESQIDQQEYYDSLVAIVGENHVRKNVYAADDNNNQINFVELKNISNFPDDDEYNEDDEYNDDDDNEYNDCLSDLDFDYDY